MDQTLKKPGDKAQTHTGVNTVSLQSPWLSTRLCTAVSKESSWLDQPCAPLINPVAETFFTDRVTSSHAQLILVWHLKVGGKRERSAALFFPCLQRLRWTGACMFVEKLPLPIMDSHQRVQHGILASRWWRLSDKNSPGNLISCATIVSSILSSNKKSTIPTLRTE
jgi:hypothetical protein